MIKDPFSVTARLICLGSPCATVWPRVAHTRARFDAYRRRFVQALIACCASAP